MVVVETVASSHILRDKVLYRHFNRKIGERLLPASEQNVSEAGIVLHC